MPTNSHWIWTRVTVSILYDDNHYTISASFWSVLIAEEWCPRVLQILPNNTPQTLNFSSPRLVALPRLECNVQSKRKTASSKNWTRSSCAYSAFPKALVLLKPHHQIVLCHVRDTLRGSLTPLQRCSRCILQAQSVGLAAVFMKICILNILFLKMF